MDLLLTPILRSVKQKKNLILFQIISDLRHCLRWEITPDNEKEVFANQKEVFDSIVRSLSASKQMYDTWMKIIQNALLDDQKSVDLIILLIMMKVNEDKTYYIEQLVCELSYDFFYCYSQYVSIYGRFGER